MKLFIARFFWVRFSADTEIDTEYDEHKNCQFDLP